MSDAGKRNVDIWYDIKTRVKQIIRSIGYNDLVQKLLCALIVWYMKLVYYSSKRVFINDQVLINSIKNRQPFILALWHSRIMMSPFMIKRAMEIEKERKAFSLSSRHGDGKFVGKVMESFGLVNIYGSSQSAKKPGRGIDIHNFREIFRALKDQICVTITPDGPRGPAQKVGGEIIKISAIAKTPIMPYACGYSRFIKLKTWDEFRIPLPFGTICYGFGDLLSVDRDILEKDLENINQLLAEKINLISSNADQRAMSNKALNDKVLNNI